jgi:GNAT superfamily N-acetyltransferase
MIIRRAIVDDSQAIAELHVAAWNAAYLGILPEAILAGQSVDARCERWRTILSGERPAEFTLAAEADGSIVGFASGGPERTGATGFAGELYALYLLPEMKRRGIGGALLSRTAQELLQRGFDSMLAWVLTENSSRRFYVRQGGKLVIQDATAIAGQTFPRVGYGWDQAALERLADRQRGLEDDSR